MLTSSSLFIYLIKYMQHFSFMEGIIVRKMRPNLLVKKHTPYISIDIIMVYKSNQV